jgi:hypothetical protein
MPGREKDVGGNSKRPGLEFGAKILKRTCSLEHTCSNVEMVDAIKLLCLFVDMATAPDVGLFLRCFDPCQGFFNLQAGWPMQRPFFDRRFLVA